MKEWATFQTRLTTVVQPMEEMGARGAALLIDKIRNGSKERRRIVLDPWLYKGETCTRRDPAPPPQR